MLAASGRRRTGEERHSVKGERAALHLDPDPGPIALGDEEVKSTSTTTHLWFRAHHVPELTDFSVEDNALRELTVVSRMDDDPFGTHASCNEVPLRLPTPAPSPSEQHFVTPVEYLRQASRIVHMHRHDGTRRLGSIRTIPRNLLGRSANVAALSQSSPMRGTHRSLGVPRPPRSAPRTKLGRMSALAAASLLPAALTRQVRTVVPTIHREVAPTSW